MNFGYPGNCEEYICSKCLEYFNREPFPLGVTGTRREQVENLLALLDRYIVKVEGPATWRNWSFYSLKSFEDWHDLAYLAASLEEKRFTLVSYDSIGPSNFRKEFERIEVRFADIHLNTVHEAKKIAAFIQRAAKFSNRSKHDDAYPTA